MATPDLTEFKIKGSILEYPGDPEDVAESSRLSHASPHFVRDIKESAGGGDGSEKNHGFAAEGG